MKKYFVLLILLFLVDDLKSQFIENQYVEFKILSTYYETDNFSVFRKNLVILKETINSAINRSDTLKIINKLKEPKYFWHANLLLFEISKLDATEIHAMFLHEESNENGYIRINNNSIDFFGEEYRNECIKKWLIWFKKQKKYHTIE